MRCDRETWVRAIGEIDTMALRDREASGEASRRERGRPWGQAAGVGTPVHAPAFYGQRYQVTVGYDRSAAQSAVVVTIRPTYPNGPYARRRPLAAFAHRVCAELEERSYQIQAPWTVSVGETMAHVSAELEDTSEVDIAGEIVGAVLAEML